MSLTLANVEPNDLLNYTYIDYYWSRQTMGVDLLRSFNDSFASCPRVFIHVLTLTLKEKYRDETYMSKKVDTSVRSSVQETRGP